MSPVVQNSSVYLVDQGSGPPILLLHGNPDSSDVWSGIITHLKEQYRCLAPDLPGFGRSATPPDFECSLDAMAAYIDDLVTAIGIDEPVILAVHDFGGPYGLAWAIKHRSKVMRIVIFNTLFFADYEWHFWARVWRRPIIGELSMKVMNRRLFEREMKKGAVNLSPNRIREAYALVTPQTKDMILRLYRATDPAKFNGWESQLLELTARVPTCVLWGDRDPYIQKKYAERFGAASVRHFPYLGHWPPAEAPTEISEILLPFLAGEPLPPDPHI